MGILYELLSMVGGSAESEYERAAAVPVPPPPPHVDPYYLEVIMKTLESISYDVKLSLNENNKMKEDLESKIEDVTDLVEDLNEQVDQILQILMHQYPYYPPSHHVTPPNLHSHPSFKGGA